MVATAAAASTHRNPEMAGAGLVLPRMPCTPSVCRRRRRGDSHMGWITQRAKTNEYSSSDGHRWHLTDRDKRADSYGDPV